jgi:hypothetical protein
MAGLTEFYCGWNGPPNSNGWNIPLREGSGFGTTRKVGSGPGLDHSDPQHCLIFKFFFLKSRNVHNRQSFVEKKLSGSWSSLVSTILEGSMRNQSIFRSRILSRSLFTVEKVRSRSGFFLKENFPDSPQMEL